MNDLVQQPVIKPIDKDGDNDLTIGKGVRFTGKVSVPNRAVINGFFDGELDAREVVVEDSGQVSGTTTANKVAVKGILNATVKCKDLLTIHATGTIKGSMEYGQIEIERGGKFEGSMKQT
jgi:cytoskeletal protein CcmA (bactofilin family)